MVAKEIKTLHDKLMMERPEGATHDEASCPICTDPEGGVGNMSDFTQEDLDAAIETATKPLREEIAKLTSSQEEIDIQNRIDEAVTPLKETITQLQADLDVAVLEASTSKDALSTTIAFLEKADADKAAEEAKATLKEERIAKVKEVASFPEDHIAASADRWVAMGDDDFTAMLDGWRLIASKEIEVKPKDEIPTQTAMTASADGDKRPEGRDAVRAFGDMVLLGLDPKRI